MCANLQVVFHYACIRTQMYVYPKGSE
ncbi:unnamed protein product [Acanthoscelides obtectus]|uniref:Uncharacterized protein n=1 Tax=Acanthoscelides obtectus TaxID=200917 RepID=A0A9P0LGE0_ACAOB|nr:unnamed protein product [Acanthoscelides obtectus]CAK1627329.1 hypothetical protein AOBTE_LOCUS4523 [Acanthoscelides obtectus]